MLEIREEPLAAGTVVANAYRLERVVGEGGMGIVWAARELRTNRTVALKFIREGRAADPRNQERFLREARAAMAVSHPAVARVEAVLETNAGVPFLVMELLEGEPLRAVLRRNTTLSALACARLFLPVVDAVLAAHAIGIVHRDLKPENVFLLYGRSDPGAVRVLDFGIAKQLPRVGETGAASLTSTGAILGTPVYMAPEQIFGDADLDAAADVWSLGIILYECLTGHAPTEGEGFGPIIRRITTDPITPLEQLRPEAPRRLTSLVGRMLTRDRARRAPLLEVRAVLAGLAEGGENAPRSVRTAALAPLRPTPAPATSGPPSPFALTEHAPWFGQSTTQGVAGPRAMSGPAPQTAPRRSPALPVVLSVLGVIVVGAVGSGLYLARSRGLSPAPTAPSGNAAAGGIAYQRAAQLQTDANAARTIRDGKACIADLDDYDAHYSGPGIGPPSSDPTAQGAIQRAMCLMLIGKCQEGKKLYIPAIRRFLPPATDAQTFDLSVTSIVADYCEGSDLSPAEALVRVNHRLFGQGKSSVTKPDAAECQRLFAEEQRLRPAVPPDQLRLLPFYEVTDPVGDCIGRSNKK